MISRPLRSGIFAGRDDELRFLRERVEDLRKGRGACVLVRGDPGIGKTRLIEELRSQAADVIFETYRCSSNVGFSDLREWLLGFEEAARRPRVLIFEDVDRMGPRALETIEWMHPNESLRIATFSTQASSAEFEESVARLRVSGAYELLLQPLEEAVMRRVVANYRAGSRRLARASAARIVELSAGNPALANEMARSLAESSAPVEHPPIPAALRAQARAMLDRLDAEALRIVLAASLIERSFDLSFLAVVVDHSEATVVEVLQRATLAGLTCEVGPNRFAFSHPLLREAVHAETTSTWSRDYHRRIATLRAGEGEDRAEDAARHYREAGERDLAIELSTKAADTFYARRAYVDAVRNLRRVVRLLDPREPSRAQALFALAYALRRGGFEDDALRVFEEILADVALTLSPDSKAKALMELMQLSYGIGDSAKVQALGKEILAMELSPESLIRSETLVRLAGFAAGEGQFDEVLALLDRIGNRPAPDVAIRARICQQRGFALAGLHDFATGLPHFEKGVALARRSNDEPLLVQLLCNVGNQALAQGRTELALERVEQAYRVAQRARSESRLHLAIATYATTLARVGRLREARALVESVEVRGSEVGGVHGYFVAVPMLEIGSMLEEPSLVQRALEIPIVEFALRSGEAQRIAPVAALFAMHFSCAGEAERARELLHEALTRVRHVRWNHWFCVAIAKCGRQEDVAPARAMLVRDVEREPPIAQAYVDLFDAFVGRRRGRNAAASRHGERAAAAFSRLQWPFFQAQALEVAGHHESALRIYDGMGDVRDANILRAAIRPSRRAGGHAVVLTEREREVIALAGQGLTSKDIAGRLAIGVRTVEHHLQMVYGKLGIRSRWQIPLDVARAP